MGVAWYGIARRVIATLCSCISVFEHAIMVRPRRVKSQITFPLRSYVCIPGTKPIADESADMDRRTTMRLPLV